MASYHQDKTTRLWYVRYRDGDAQRKLSKHPTTGEKFKTKKAAQCAYQLLAEQAKKADEIAPAADDTPRTVGDLYALYLPYKKARTKETSHYDLEVKFKTRILPFWADRELISITPATVLTWLNSLNDCSIGYQRTLLSLLGGLFIFGNKYHGISNPVKNVDKPREKGVHKEMEVWTPEEFLTVLKACPKIEYAAYFAFLFFSGCRKGEGGALLWKDLDLDNGTVLVSKSVSSKTHGRGGAPYAITTTKTGRTRRISIPDKLCSFLREYRHRIGDPTQDSFVFGGSRPLPTSSIDRAFISAINAANVKRIRIHDLRHSCASILISSGVSIVAVSRHLGHKDVTETLNTYAHLLPEDDVRLKQISNASAALLAF